MDVFTCYLSGGMSKFGKDEYYKGNQWRQLIQEELESFEGRYRVYCDNPNDYYGFLREPTYKSEREVMEFFLNKVRNAKLLIVNFNDPNSLGTMSEVAIAYDRRIPVIGLKEEEQKLYSWQEEMCNRIFTDLEELIEYIKQFYLS